MSDNQDADRHSFVGVCFDLDGRWQRATGMLARDFDSVSAGQEFEWVAYEWIVARNSFALFKCPSRFPLVKPTTGPSASMSDDDFQAAALRGGIARLVLARQALQAIGQNLAVMDPVKVEDTVTDLLEARLDAVAAGIEFGPMVDASNRNRNAQIELLVDVFCSSLNALDDLLDENAGVVSVISNSNWIDNLQGCLPDDAFQPRPWWLTEQASALWEEYASESADIRDAIRQRQGPALQPFDQAVNVVPPEEQGDDDTEPESWADSELKSSPPGSRELSATFDVSDAGPGVTLMAFQDDRAEGRIEVGFHLSVEHESVSIDDLHSDTKFDVVIRLEPNTVLTSADQTQTWRFRMGLFWIDVQIEHDEFAGMIGHSTATIGELLTRGRTNNQWCEAYVRRIG